MAKKEYQKPKCREGNKAKEIVLLHRREPKTNTHFKNNVCFAFWKSIPLAFLPSLCRDMGRFSNEKRWGKLCIQANLGDIEGSVLDTTVQPVSQ